MAIPESQLETWSHQGSITQSSNTYNTIKNVLEANDTPYAGKDYKIFLQGSYGNSTNIYSESDVDIVIVLNDAFQRDLSQLSQSQQDTYISSHSDATYTHTDFKLDVLSVLSTKYNSDIDPRDKAIAILANGNRRKADVVASVRYRRYYKFISIHEQSYDEGICFFTSSGEKIINYPEYHRKNLTNKHQNASMQFKPMARIFKNLRSRLISEGMLANTAAPSYYLEGLLYNVPNNKFVSNYNDSFIDVINWILEADRTKFMCANEQYDLFHDNSPVTWRTEKCDAFLDAAVDLWTQW